MSNNPINSKELLSGLSFCVIDLETTGGNHNKDKIIEIGMVKISQCRLSDTKSFLINPEMPIPEFIQKLTNISQDKVKDAATIEEVIDEVLEFIGDDIIVAHNTSFDVPFLNSVLKRLQKPKLENNVICTNVMTKHLMPEILNSNLNYMSRLFNIDHSKAHRAYDDALATAKLLLIYLDIFADKGIKKINQLYYPRNKFELDRVHLDNSFSNEQVTDYIAKIESSTLLTIKGERGLILAVLPLEAPGEELGIVKDILNELDWKIITIKLIKPMIEGIFQFNNHYFKYPVEVKNKISDYLYKRYGLPEEQRIKLEKLDFVLSHHLISDQVIVHSFLHLNTNTKFLFKIPAQKKKLHQFLIGQINRFENNQKGQKKHLIHQELVGLVESFLAYSNKENAHLMLSRKYVKEDKEGVLKTIENFVSQDKNNSNFPTKHL